MSGIIEPNHSERRMIYAVWDGIMSGETMRDLIYYVRIYDGTRIRRQVRAAVIRNIRRLFAEAKENPRTSCNR